MPAFAHGVSRPCHLQTLQPKPHGCPGAHFSSTHVATPPSLSVYVNVRMYVFRFLIHMHRGQLCFLPNFRTCSSHVSTSISSLVASTSESTSPVLELGDSEVLALVALGVESRDESALPSLLHPMPLLDSMLSLLNYAPLLDKIESSRLASVSPEVASDDPPPQLPSSVPASMSVVPDSASEEFSPAELSLDAIPTEMQSATC